MNQDKENYFRVLENGDIVGPSFHLNAEKGILTFDKPLIVGAASSDSFITREELVMALTQYYQDLKDNPEDFTNELSEPANDAKNVAGVLFDIIRSNHE